MKIVIDTREQLPYRFEIPTVAAALDVGDYSIEGFEHLIAIERKEINDLVGCLTEGRERFERELRRSRALEYFALVIEASLADLALHRYRSKMSPKSVVQSLLTFSIRYGVHVFFAGDRVHAQRLTESLLTKYGREIEKRAKLLLDSEASG